MLDEWFYEHLGRIYGPVSIDEMRSALRFGFALPTDRVRHRITQDWAAAEMFVELRDLTRRGGGEKT